MRKYFAILLCVLALADAKAGLYSPAVSRLDRVTRNISDVGQPFQFNSIFTYFDQDGYRSFIPQQLKSTVIDLDDAKCSLIHDGQNYQMLGFNGQLKSPLLSQLETPRQIACDVQHNFSLMCLVDNKFGLTCVSSRDALTNQRPDWTKFFGNLSSASDLKLGPGFACAISKTEKWMKCIGDNAFRKGFTYQLENPKEMAIVAGVSSLDLASHACVLDNKKIKCWIASTGEASNPSDRQYEAIFSLNLKVCGLRFDLRSFDCHAYLRGGLSERPYWADFDNDINKLPVPAKSIGVEFRSPDGTHEFLIFSDGQNLYREETGCRHSDNFRNPSDEAFDMNPKIQELNCWRPAYPNKYEYGTAVNTPFFLGRVDKYIAYNRKKLNPIRAAYLQGLIDSFQQDLPPEDDQSRSASLSRLFPLALLEKSIATADSKESESLRFEFQRSLPVLAVGLGFQNLEEAYLKIPVSDQTVRFAMSSLKRLLVLAQQFVPPADQDKIHESIRLIGQAYTEPMNPQKVRDVLTSVSGLTTVREKLEHSLKTAFLIQTLDLTTAWLEQVK